LGNLLSPGWFPSSFYLKSSLRSPGCVCPGTEGRQGGAPPHAWRQGSPRRRDPMRAKPILSPTSPTSFRHRTWNLAVDFRMARRFSNQFNLRWDDPFTYLRFSDVLDAMKLLVAQRLDGKIRSGEINSMAGYFSLNRSINPSLRSCVLADPSW